MSRVYDSVKEATVCLSGVSPELSDSRETGGLAAMSKTYSIWV